MPRTCWKMDSLLKQHAMERKPFSILCSISLWDLWLKWLSFSFSPSCKLRFSWQALHLSPGTSVGAQLKWRAAIKHCEKAALVLIINCSPKPWSYLVSYVFCAGAICQEWERPIVRSLCWNKPFLWFMVLLLDIREICLVCLAWGCQVFISIPQVISQGANTYN